jgi:AAA domain-containing protein
MPVTCDCAAVHQPVRVVLTGGPGAGKTAVLELIRQYFCSHVRVLPEAAGIVFGGGFPREQHPECCRAAQRAIFHVQRELELVGDVHRPAIVLCDRGTVDGAAYWPGAPSEFWSSLGTNLEGELARYAVVIHLRSPDADGGYNHSNPLRIESALTAAEIDSRIFALWATHPRRFVVDASPDFFGKATAAIEILRNEIPECCIHPIVRLHDDSPMPGMPGSHS